MGQTTVKNLPLDTSETKTPRFVGLSVVLHLAGLIALVAVSATSFEKPLKEQVVIELTSGDPQASAVEIADSAEAPSEGIQAQAPLAAVPSPAPRAEPKTMPVAKPLVIPPSQSSVVKSEPLPITQEKEEAPTIQPVEEAANPVVASTDTEEAVEATPQPLPPPTQVLTTSPKPVAVMTPALNASIEDIETPDLSEPVSTVVAVPAKKSAEKADLKALSDGESKALAGLGGDLEKTQSALDKWGEGAGQKGQGENSVGQAPEGAGDIRGLENIRQMPGNPRPSYSENERAQRQQGEVIFWAYVSKDGRLVEFKQTKSTGHSSLDQKTLAALKQWKFYPGQEGWVEIPFRWDIRGWPQEMSALSRSKLSQKID